MADAGRPRSSRRRLVGGAGDPEVFCADEQDEVPVDVERWQRLAEAVLAAEGVRGGTELSVMFVDRDTIAELNRTHLGQPGPTDVLSFPIDAGEVVEIRSGPGGATPAPDRSPTDPGELPLLLGDVVICPAVAAEQAPTHAGTLDDELALLLVHGILHVLGHDHAEPEEAERMRARERELLCELHWSGPPPAGFRQEQEP